MKVMIVVGPTASGKSSFAMQKAIELGGEIINADSRQIYKDLLIGTASPTGDDIKKIHHHLFNFLEVDKKYSAFDFVQDATDRIQEVLNRKKIPIVVGGTGLYIDSLVFGYKSPPVDHSIRQSYEDRSTESLYDELLKKDPEYAETINYNSRFYIVRALEIIEGTGMTRTQAMKERKKPDFDFEFHYLTYPRDILVERINKRVDDIWANWILEVKSLRQQYGDNFEEPAFSSLGYREINDFLNGDMTEVEAKELIKIKTRQYAKRQETWFRRPQWREVLGKVA